MSFRSRLLVVLLSLVAAVPFTVPFAAAAQQPAPAGGATVHGLVVDPDDALVPGATVTLTPASGKGAQTATSKSDGTYTFRGVAPGTYVVTATAPGFAVFLKEGVKVAAGANLALDTKLSIAEQSQQMTVTADSVQLSVDPENNASSTVISGAALDALSDDPDELSAELSALAGPSAGPNGGQIYIDGFTGGQLPPKSSIREIRINSNPFAAEYDKLGFGRIEILTKPGTDKLHGQAFFNFGDKDFNTRNPFVAVAPPFQSELFGGYVSGALNKKTSFFLDVERRSIDENALVVANVLDSNYNVVPFNSGSVTPIRDITVSPRIDYALNATNTLTARYSYSDRTSGNQGVGQFNLLSRAYQQDSGEQTIQLTETILPAEWRMSEIDELHYDDIAAVLPLVTHWCSRNCISISIDFDYNGGFTCVFQPATRQSGMKFESVEIGNNWELCHQLLLGCVLVAKKLDRVYFP